ncbi:MAG TPA: DUF503 domain-containing protein [Spirochaetia bacterium]|nr:DUF503 domain-containing protein [Spirochaetia bacterium]
MVQFIIELPDIESIKDKRRIVSSLKAKMQRKYRLSVSEVDLHDSHSFSQIGAALVSNSRQFGESVLQKAMNFVEDEIPGRVHDIQIHSERY